MEVVLMDRKLFFSYHFNFERWRMNYERVNWENLFIWESDWWFRENFGLNMKIVPANIWHFDFSPCKNIFLVLVPANIKKIGFGPWYFVLVFVKLIHIELGPYNPLL